MIRLRFVVATLAGMLFAAVPLVAHHSFAAEFDSSKPIKLKGKLSGAALVNPHGWLKVDVTDDALNRQLSPPVTGKTVTWSVETGGVNALFRRGWRAKDLPLGKVVVVEGFMAKACFCICACTSGRFIASRNSLLSRCTTSFGSFAGP